MANRRQRRQARLTITELDRAAIRTPHAAEITDGPRAPIDTTCACGDHIHCRRARERETRIGSRSQSGEAPRIRGSAPACNHVGCLGEPHHALSARSCDHEGSQGRETRRRTGSTRRDRARRARDGCDGRSSNAAANDAPTVSFSEFRPGADIEPAPADMICANWATGLVMGQPGSGNSVATSANTSRSASKTLT